MPSQRHPHLACAPPWSWLTTVVGESALDHRSVRQASTGEPTGRLVAEAFEAKSVCYACARAASKSPILPPRPKSETSIVVALLPSILLHPHPHPRLFRPMNDFPCNCPFKRMLPLHLALGSFLPSYPALCFVHTHYSKSWQACKAPLIDGAA